MPSIDYRYRMAAPRTDQWAWDRMVDALRLLALPADTQVAALPSFVEVPDELALSFDEAYRALTVDGLTGAFSASQLTALAEIDRSLEEMSRPPRGALAWTPELLELSAWTIDALYADERWGWLRRSARRLLRALGVESGRPDLSHTIYVGPDRLARPGENG